MSIIDKVYEKIFFSNNYFIVYFFSIFSILLIILFLLFTFDIKFNEVYKNNGLIVSSNQKQISTYYDGIIQTNNIVIGKEYKRGDILISFDNSLKEKEIKKYKSQLEFMKKKQNAMMLSTMSFSSIEIEEYQTNINEIENKLYESLIVISNNTLVVPFDSILIESNYDGYEKGFIEKGTIVAKLIPVNDYIIKVKISDNWISRIKTGQKVKITFNDSKFDGEVTKIILESEYSIYAYIFFENKNNIRITGISVETEIIVNEKVSIKNMLYKAFKIQINEP